MRAITKWPEPRVLSQYRAAYPEDYDGFSGKGALRTALVGEQRGLCCYCMGRIVVAHHRMKIEHWRSQDHYPMDRLRYGNLLGACIGGEGQPPKLQHCDTSKGDKNLLFNPSNLHHQIEHRIWYQADGIIRSNTAEFDRELETVLNLNIAVFKAARKAVLDGIISWWKLEKERLRGAVDRRRFEQKRAELLRVDGDLRPFSQVSIWWIDKRLDNLIA